MKKQLVHLSVHQTSKVIALLHAVLFTIVMLIPAISLILEGDRVQGLILLIVSPFFMWLFGYIYLAVMCFFYNFAAKWVGGIEFELADKIVKIETLREESPSVDVERRDL